MFQCFFIVNISSKPFFDLSWGNTVQLISEKNIDVIVKLCGWFHSFNVKQYDKSYESLERVQNFNNISEKTRHKDTF